MQSTETDLKLKIEATLNDLNYFHGSIGKFEYIENASFQNFIFTPELQETYKNLRVVRIETIGEVVVYPTHTTKSKTCTYSICMEKLKLAPADIPVMCHILRELRPALDKLNILQTLIAKSKYQQQKSKP